MEMHEALAICAAYHTLAVVKIKEVEPNETWYLVVQRPGVPSAKYIDVTRETLLALAAAHGHCREIVLKYRGSR